jgi:2'-5' RNA ligase
MATRFIFVEISDPEILSLITSIRESAMGAMPTSDVHITVRGPYHCEIPIRQLERCQQLLSAQPLVLNGVGEFQAGNTHVVYLKVQHPGLRRIWWKPDYPVNTFGFNPHITVYEGANADEDGLIFATTTACAAHSRRECRAVAR